MIKSVLVLEAGGPAGMSCIKRIKKNFNDVKIIAADMDLNSPSFIFSDFAEVVPAGSDPKFAEVVKKIINKYKIDLVLPCFENAFTELSQINGPFVTDFKNAILCKDKLKFNIECERLGLPVPITITVSKNNIPHNYPQYVKPCKGVGSRDNFVIKSEKEYMDFINLRKDHENFISQEFIVGDHWNIDVLVGKNGFISSIERKDLKQKDGNCITVEVMSYDPLAKFARKVQETLNIVSPFNLEVFETTAGHFIINEINLRFGGGIIFGALAGRDFISYLISNECKYLGAIERGIYTRYYEEVLIKNT